MGSLGLCVMATDSKIRQFLFPSLTLRFLIRISLVAVLAYLFFGYVCIPLRIQGSSMTPTYRSGGLNLLWRLRYVRSHPRRFDVVAVRFTGDKVMLLKRVVALAGETIEFRDGKLFVNGLAIDEPYVRHPCDWDLPPRLVEKDSVYVVGDNRSMPMENHVFGQAPVKRIIGGPLW